MLITKSTDTEIEFHLDDSDIEPITLEQIGYLGEMVLVEDAAEWLIFVHRVDDITLRELLPKITLWHPPTWAIFELWDGTRLVAPYSLTITESYPFLLAGFDTREQALTALKDMEVPDAS